MKATIPWGIALGLALAGLGAAQAQLLPSLPAIGRADGLLGAVVDPLARLPDEVARTLETARIDRIGALVRAHPDAIALDPAGFPARAGEVVVTDPAAAPLTAALAARYRVVERGDLLGIPFVRLAPPPGRGLAAAIRDLRKLGLADVSADQLHQESGVGGGGVAVSGGDGTRVGVIDGGVAGLNDQRGFARGAPRASDHGSAVASLVLRAAPGSRLLAADVYGDDPAGGSAVAIAKALAWLTGERVPVVNISLVGPANPLLARVVAAAQARGTMIVAPVGNDGPAAPPGFPASYPGVIAVTAVDARNRILIEAGRATHVDYAAPGADMIAGNARGGAAAVRGTSFAAPLVAGRLARIHAVQMPARRAAVLRALDASARPLGRRYGRGLLCAECRTNPR